MTDMDSRHNYTPLEKPVRITEHNWPEGTLPFVSIRCTTYNHMNFIRDAIESFLLQETIFPVEILIHDDASTDGTADILQEYEKKYPKLFKIYTQKINTYWSADKLKLRIPFYKSVTGKYVAICEGDDYWIDPYKLQKQVNFLEDNHEYVAHYHHCITKINDRFIDLDTKRNKSFTFSQVDSINGKNGYTLSLMYRAESINMTDNKYINYVESDVVGDWQMELYLLLPKKTKGFYLRETMGVYRIHDEGIINSYYSKKSRREIMHGKYKVLCKIEKMTDSNDALMEINKRKLIMSLQLMRYNDCNKNVDYGKEAYQIIRDNNNILTKADVKYKTLIKSILMYIITVKIIRSLRRTLRI